MIGKRSTKEEDQEDRLKHLSCQCDETLREVPSMLIHHDSYEEESLLRTLRTAFRSLQYFRLVFFNGSN